jgi:hypothetical protein
VSLTGFALDSDTVFVEGFSAGGGHWRACLVREAAEAHCEDDNEDFDAELPPPEEAAHAAAVWASKAGLLPDPSDLLEVFAGGHRFRGGAVLPAAGSAGKRAG